MATIHGATYIRDERWGGHFDIGKQGCISINKALEQWTLELWIRLEYHPIIRNDTKIINPRLLTLNIDRDVIVYYTKDSLILHDKRTQQQDAISYPENQWFQLVLVNGIVGQVNTGSGTIYLNGKKISTGIGLNTMKRITIGNILSSHDKLQVNRNYTTGSNLSVVRIYQTTLDKHQVYNNYLAEAKKYGLLLQREASPIRDELALELIAGPGRTKYNHWLSSLEMSYEQRRTNSEPETNKNMAQQYIMDKQIHELTKLIQKLNTQAALTSHADIKTHNSKAPNTSPSEQQVSNKDSTNPIDGNIIILSENPELFLKQLQEKSPSQIKSNQDTNKIMTKGRSATSVNYTAIFQNPFKLKLFANYLQSKPEHFISILNSDTLTPEQLVTLNNAISTNQVDSQPNAQANRVLEGFIAGPLLKDGRSAKPTGEYIMAVELLRNKIDHNTSQNHTGRTGHHHDHDSHLNQLSHSAGQIADIMSYNHQQDLLRERQAEKSALINVIRGLNHRINNATERTYQLEQLLREQHSLLGLVISRQTKKCIGTIDNKGKMRHCDHKEAKSPYDIVVKPDTYLVNLENILQQHNLQGATIERLIKHPGLSVLGQCVNTSGKTVGAIVRMKGNKGNQYIPTKETEPNHDVPILAILTTPDTQAPKKETAKPKCASGKCEPGYVPKANADQKILKKSWVDMPKKAEKTNKQANKPPKIGKAAPVLKSDDEDDLAGTKKRSIIGATTVDDMKSHAANLSGKGAKIMTGLLKRFT